MRMLAHKRRRQSGSMAIEVAMWLPVMFLLIVGTLQFGKITYTYYTLTKIVNTAAAYLAAQSGVNFCPDAGDANITAAFNFAVSGASDGSGTPIITDLTADMLTVTTQCIDPTTGELADCAVSGCSTPVGAQRPDFITVSLPNGYTVQPRIPYLLLDPIPLRPKSTVAYGGGS